MPAEIQLPPCGYSACCSADQCQFRATTLVRYTDNQGRPLHVTRSTTDRLLKRNQIPAFRIGRHWRFNLEKIDNWCASHALSKEPKGVFRHACPVPFERYPSPAVYPGYDCRRKLLREVQNYARVTAARLCFRRGKRFRVASIEAQKIRPGQCPCFFNIMLDFRPHLEFE
jgi:excisionase family DNA binding protein